MAFSPSGYAPAVPGLTEGDGAALGGMSPMQMVAMLMGTKPDGVDSTTEKMAKVVQLLREVSKEDPRIALIASDALRLLIEGPTAMPAGQGPGAGSSLPVGGPGAMIG